MFFDNWFGLLSGVVVGVLAYGGLVLFLRAGEKRTLSKMNAFDLVVTVAPGSTLATVPLTKHDALVEGQVGFGVLIGLPFAGSWLSARWTTVRRLVRAVSTLRYFPGEFFPAALEA